MKTITVRLLNPTLNVMVAVISFLMLILLCHLILSRYLQSELYPFLTLILSGVVSAYLAKYLSKGIGKITINDDTVLVTVYNEYLNRDYSYIIPRNHISAFEIYKDKFFTRLIFYRFDKGPKAYTLISNKEQESELVDFFKNDFRYLDIKSPLSSETFLSAFFKSFILLSVLLAGLVSVYIAINWLYYSSNGKMITVNRAYWFLLTTTFLLIYNKVHNKKGFKLGGRNVTWIIFTFLTFIIYFTLIPASYSIFQKPIEVEDLADNIHDYNSKFLIPEQISTDTTLIGYTAKISTKHKSRYNTITHYFTVPVLHPENKTELNHPVWIGADFKQSVLKSTSLHERDVLRIEFLNQKGALFKKVATEHAGFYEVVHHQNNKAFRNMNFLRSASSTGHAKQPTVIVLAHRESFEYFQNSEKQRILLVSLIFIAVLLFNAMLVAINR